MRNAKKVNTEGLLIQTKLSNPSESGIATLKKILKSEIRIGKKRKHESLIDSSFNGLNTSIR